jgi:hypothetical protein
MDGGRRLEGDSRVSLNVLHESRLALEGKPLDSMRLFGNQLVPWRSAYGLFKNLK